jgi:hypothetical protein
VRAASEFQSGQDPGSGERRLLACWFRLPAETNFLAVRQRDGNSSVVPSVFINDRRSVVSFSPIPWSLAKSSTL